MTEQQITINVNPHQLDRVTDEWLVMLWHVAQANPADGFENEEPGDLVMKIGWEIIRRWLNAAPTEMYHHQQRHYYWKQLSRFAKWNGTEWVARDPDQETTCGSSAGNAVNTAGQTARREIREFLEVKQAERAAVRPPEPGPVEASR